MVKDALLVKCIHKEIFDIIVICSTISEYQLRDCQFNIQANKVTQQLKGNTTANPSMSKLKGTNVQQCHLRLPWKRKQEYLCDGYVQMILSSPVQENKLIVAMGNFSFTIRSNRTEELSEDEEESFHKWLIVGLTVLFMISFLFLVTFMLCKKRGFLRARKMKKRINKVSAVGENVCLEDISRSKVSLHIYETVLEDDESLVSKRKWICL